MKLTKTERELVAKRVWEKVQRAYQLQVENIKVSTEYLEYLQKQKTVDVLYRELLVIHQEAEENSQVVRKFNIRWDELGSKISEALAYKEPFQNYVYRPYSHNTNVATSGLHNVNAAVKEYQIYLLKNYLSAAGIRVPTKEEDVEEELILMGINTTPDKSKPALAIEDIINQVVERLMPSSVKQLPAPIPASKLDLSVTLNYETKQTSEQPGKRTHKKKNA